MWGIKIKNNSILLAIIILFILLIGVIISFNVVSSEENFKTLQNEIDNNENSIDLKQDYKYDNSSDNELNKGILINKSNIVINGNGHTIDGSNQSRIFNITGKNVTITNLTLINGNSGKNHGGAIYANSNMNLENVKFTNNVADMGGAIFNNNTTNITNCIFDNNAADSGGCIFSNNELKIYNSTFTNSKTDSGSAIYACADMDIKDSTFKDLTATENGGAIYTSNNTKITNCHFSNTNAKWGGSIYSSKKALDIDNSTFINSNAKYSPAIYAQGNITIDNSFFKNLKANETAGAIGLRELISGEINNCTFVNTTSKNDGGAINIDGNINKELEMHIANSKFFNSHANYGGALVQSSGNLTIENSTFGNNSASCDGAAIYTSGLDFNMNNCIFESNKILMKDLNNGGAIYCDITNLTSNSSSFTNNTKNAIYAYDSNINITKNNFKNNHEAIHCVFSTNTLTNNNYINDTLVLNETDYNSIIAEKGIKFNLTNKTTNMKPLPSRFDMRDVGWVTPVKAQGDANSCWAFGSCGALESALLKSTGVQYDLSESHMVNTMLENSKYGLSKDADDGGYSDWALEYILSWLGPVTQEDDQYDEFGRLTPLINQTPNIHIQDAILVEPPKNFTDNDGYKKALMKYGALDISYTNFEGAPYYNNNTSAQYQNISQKQDHEVTLVGWDDNYSASNFIVTPPGDGAWIIKNSWNTTWGEDGYGYLSYYDVGIAKNSYTVGYIIENTENYTKNYQTDLSGNLSIDEYNNTVSYSNNFTSLGNELISGVGTYFSEEGEKYSLDIYVNGQLKHTQNGTAPYYGFHTVKLTKEIPIKQNDTFKVVMKKKSIPVLSYSRQHYLQNTTFVNHGNGWKDISLENKTISLKVYTKD